MIQTIFFGANDAVLFPGRQHVPLEKYTTFLEQIILHPAVRDQGTKLLLLTPPPVNEHQLNYQKFVLDDSSRRTAANTKLYADACRGVGNALGVAVVDLWSAFMKAAGWKEGEPLAGSRDIPENTQLAALLSDGMDLVLSQ
jgi:lysophospholipase L1-like esterase